MATALKTRVMKLVLGLLESDMVLFLHFSAESGYDNSLLCQPALCMLARRVKAGSFMSGFDRIDQIYGRHIVWP